ncbi:Protein FANTASTIC FOUR 4 [Acorus calamus]|uniref:Protein FANTASTIC FOUR 4 n=1 Tax=Acorus calamus TaxID=4465 RepID=A0AAV9EY85_ACOCL|nr:Protein FANTASTIC FOUR 4 [Acorus calamus]
MAPPSSTAFEAQTFSFFPTKSIKGDAFRGWSLPIESRTIPTTQNPPPPPQTEHTKTSFAYPLGRRSPPASRMSEESLALCTESLGCETGVVDFEEDLLGILSSPPPPPSPVQSGSSLLRRQRTARDFPPPMKSIEAVKYVQHREGQRLVVKAVRASTVLKADRTGGRVRLCYVKRVDDEVTRIEEDEEEEVEEEETEEEEEEEETEENEDLNENSWNYGEEIGIENYGRRLSRCKEGGRVMPWERFLVAST